MIVTIDFSIFSSPTDALGNVSGNMNVVDAIREGDEVFLLKTENEHWFSGKLRIDSILQLSGDREQTLVSLEDVVAPSTEEAHSLAARLKGEAGLFFDQYD